MHSTVALFLEGPQSEHGASFPDLSSLPLPDPPHKHFSVDDAWTIFLILAPGGAAVPIILLTLKESGKF